MDNSSLQYPIEIDPPDLEIWRSGNAGIDFVHSFDSGRPGPHVMVSALVHGNELSGAVVLDWLLRLQVRPTRGRLTLAFINVEAYQAFDPTRPDDSRFVDEDMNRVWDAATLDGERTSRELTRARALRSLLDGVDFLLDIHSMQHPTPPLLLCGPTRKGRELARAIGYPMYVMADQGHAAGRRMRDYRDFGDEASPRNALLVECGQHFAASSAVVAKEMTLRFLSHFEIIDPAFVRSHLLAGEPATQQIIEITDPVTIETDQFRFAGDFVGMEVLPKAGDLIGHDGEREIRAPYDNCVLIMPSRRLEKGLTAVRLGRFVDC
ncbi:M14 family metallopeptidase [Piscinibacter sakaiensis]|uniref:M14 family metallopeptidase n=1 Tax=Piscinibacter sakaiensis TaxID=1547922 RepID=UPI003AAB6804